MPWAIWIGSKVFPPSVDRCTLPSDETLQRAAGGPAPSSLSLRDACICAHGRLGRHARGFPWRTLEKLLSQGQLLPCCRRDLLPRPRRLGLSRAKVPHQPATRPYVSPVLRMRLWERRRAQKGGRCGKSPCGERASFLTFYPAHHSRPEHSPLETRRVAGTEAMKVTCRLAWRAQRDCPRVRSGWGSDGFLGRRQFAGGFARFTFAFAWAVREAVGLTAARGQLGERS